MLKLKHVFTVASSAMLLSGGLSAPARADGVFPACVNELWDFADGYADHGSAAWTSIVNDNIEQCYGNSNSIGGNDDMKWRTNWSGWRLGNYPGIKKENSD